MCECDLGPWTNKKKYYQFSLLILDPRFPRSYLMSQTSWVKDKLTFEIDPDCSRLVEIGWPTLLAKLNLYSVGIYVYDQEIATMIKLAYS